MNFGFDWQLVLRQAHRFLCDFRGDFLTAHLEQNPDLA